MYFLDVLHIASDGGDGAGQLVARDERVARVRELRVGEVNICVADPAVENSELHIIRPRHVPLDLKLTANAKHRWQGEEKSSSRILSHY